MVQNSHSSSLSRANNDALNDGLAAAAAATVWWLGGEEKLENRRTVFVIYRCGGMETGWLSVSSPSSDMSLTHYAIHSLSDYSTQTEQRYPCSCSYWKFEMNRSKMHVFFLISYSSSYVHTWSSGNLWFEKKYCWWRKISICTPKEGIICETKNVRFWEH